MASNQFGHGLKYTTKKTKIFVCCHRIVRRKTPWYRNGAAATSHHQLFAASLLHVINFTDSLLTIPHPSNHPLLHIITASHLHRFTSSPLHIFTSPLHSVTASQHHRFKSFITLQQLPFHAAAISHHRRVIISLSHDSLLRTIITSRHHIFTPASLTSSPLHITNATSHQQPLPCNRCFT